MCPSAPKRDAGFAFRCIVRIARLGLGLVERWGSKVCADDRAFRAAQRLIARRANRCARARAERWAIRSAQAIAYAGLAAVAVKLGIGIQRAEERIAQQRKLEEMRRTTPIIEPRIIAPEADPQTRLVWLDGAAVTRSRRP